MNLINGGIALVLCIAALVLYLVAKWRIFIKMGEEGWKALIPVYSEYLLFKNVWNVKAFWAVLALEVSSSILGHLTPYIQGTPQMVAMLCGVALEIAGIVMLVKLAMRISRCFGHGVGYGIGLFLAGPIFNMILAFGDSKYERA